MLHRICKFRKHAIVFAFRQYRKNIELNISKHIKKRDLLLNTVSCKSDYTQIILN